MQFLVNVFRPLNARTIAERELKDAELQLLVSQTTAEYGLNMSNYNRTKILRLQKYLQETC